MILAKLSKHYKISDYAIVLRAVERIERHIDDSFIESEKRAIKSALEDITISTISGETSPWKKKKIINESLKVISDLYIQNKIPLPYTFNELENITKSMFEENCTKATWQRTLGVVAIAAAGGLGGLANTCSNKEKTTKYDQLPWTEKVYYVRDRVVESVREQ